MKKDFYTQTELKKYKISDQVSDQVKLYKQILEFCLSEKTLTEIIQKFGYKNRIYFKSKYLNPLIKEGLIGLTNPKSLQSPTQKYYTIKKQS